MGFESFGGGQSLENRDRARTVDALLAEKEIRPKIENFESVYGAEAVKRDSAETARLKALYAKRFEGDSERQMGRRFSEAFERLFKIWAVRLSWFGEHSEIISTSEYDDFVKGVDGILVLNEERKGSEYMALAIDTTHAGAEKVDEKMLRALDRVTDGEEPFIVKYFERKNFRGQLRGSVPVIIGLDDRDANEIIDTIGQVLNLLRQKNRVQRQNEILQEKMTFLKSHPAQVVFLEEIRLQLAMYQRALAKVAEPNTQIQETKAHVENIQRLIHGIQMERGDIDMGELEQDRVLAAIKAFCESQK